jgi:hypothetical protein
LAVSRPPAYAYVWGVRLRAWPLIAYNAISSRGVYRRLFTAYEIPTGVNIVDVCLIGSGVCGVTVVWLIIFGLS